MKKIYESIEIYVLITEARTSLRLKPTAVIWNTATWLAGTSRTVSPITDILGPIVPLVITEISQGLPEIRY